MFGVWGLGFGVCGLGFRVSTMSLRIPQNMTDNTKDNSAYSFIRRVNALKPPLNPTLP